MEFLSRHRILLAHAVFFAVQLVIFVFVVQLAVENAIPSWARWLQEGAPFLGSFIALFAVYFVLKKPLEQKERRLLIFSLPFQVLLFKGLALLYPAFVYVFLGSGDIDEVTSMYVGNLSNDPAKTHFVILSILNAAIIGSFLGIVIGSWFIRKISNIEAQEPIWHNSAKYVALFIAIVVGFRLGFYFLPEDIDTGNVGNYVFLLAVLVVVQAYFSRQENVSASDLVIFRQNLFFASVFVAILTIMSALFFLNAFKNVSVNDRDILAAQSLFGSVYSVLFVPVISIFSYAFIRWHISSEFKRKIKKMEKERLENAPEADEKIA